MRGWLNGFFERLSRSRMQRRNFQEELDTHRLLVALNYYTQWKKDPTAGAEAILDAVDTENEALCKVGTTEKQSMLIQHLNSQVRRLMEDVHRTGTSFKLFNESVACVGLTEC